MSVENYSNAKTIQGTKSPFFICEIEAKFVLQDEPKEGVSEVLMSSPIWETIFQELYKVYDMPVEHRVVDDRLVPGSLCKTCAERSWVWKGFGEGESHVNENLHEATCVGPCVAIAPKSTKTYSPYFIGEDREPGMVFVLCPTTVGDKRGFFSVEISQKKSPIVQKMRLSSECSQLLIVNSLTARIKIKPNVNCEVKYMPIRLLSPEWHRLFDFTPVPRDPRDALFWNQLDGLNTLHYNCGETIQYHLSKTLDDISLCVLQFHLVFLSSPVGDCHDLTAPVVTDETRESGATLHKELLLNPEEARFFRECKKRYSQVACVEILCESQPVDLKPECWHRREPATEYLTRIFEDGCEYDRLDDDRFMSYYPYPFECVLGTRTQTIRLEKTQYDEVKVLALIINK